MKPEEFVIVTHWGEKPDFEHMPCHLEIIEGIYEDVTLAQLLELAENHDCEAERQKRRETAARQAIISREWEIARARETLRRFGELSEESPS